MTETRSSDGLVALAHGWAFDAGVWDPLVETLGLAGRVVFNGSRFLDQGPATSETVPNDAILIGFSFGAMWLLAQRPQRIRAFIAISGFSCLDRPANVDAMRALRAGLDRNPAAQVKAFRRLAGNREPVPETALNVPELIQGLETMLTTDARREALDLDCPLLVLASRDDPVIPPAVVETSWPAASIRWRETGGHALPLSEPHWCAQEIERFLRDRLS